MSARFLVPLLRAALLATVLLSPFLARADEVKTYDIVVYGGTSAGVVAAVQARRMDRSVVLIEPTQHLGGLTSGGLGQTDSGNEAAIGGMALEFYQRVHDHYEKPEAWYRQKPESYRPFRPDSETMWKFEPHVAEAVFDQWAEESGVDVVRGARLDRERGVRINGGRIESLTTTDGRTFAGKVFLDTTYEGDLMAAAGVSFSVGRESNARYGETLNGVQVENTNKRVGDKYVPVDPYRTPGDRSSGLVWGITHHDPGTDGEADDCVQAYCFRMCLTDVPENRVPFSRPDNYDEAHYELLLRWFETGQRWVPWINSPMPNRKTDTNNNGVVIMSTDFIGGNYDYPEASDARRAEIVADHRNYQMGLMWTMANHPRVPKSIRNEVSRWGLANDEFDDNDHWPRQLYVREARRMIGDYVMTEHDCLRKTSIDRSIGLGSYALDSHHVQRYVTSADMARNEGNLYSRVRVPYPIAYGAIVPRKEECQNLLVPVCLSASHIAYGSIRMEPVFMILAQSAATAAAQSLTEEVAVQDINYGQLHVQLIADKQVLEMPHRKGSTAKGRTIASFKGIVVDDDAAQLEGEWKENNVVGPFVADGYRHDADAQKGKLKARFETQLKPGSYEVRLAFPAHTNRAKKVPVNIVHDGGTTLKYIDQRGKASEANLFVSLGTYNFGTKGAVVISNEGTQGHVAIDAVQFLPKEDVKLK